MREELFARGRQCKLLTQPGTPTASLVDVLNDSDSVVCATALLGLRKRFSNAIERLCPYLDGPTKRALENKKEDWFLQTAIAALHPDEDVLLQLFNKGNWSVRLALANRPDCPEGILDLLATLPVETSEHLRDRFDVIRNIAIKRSASIKKTVDDEF